MTCEAVVSVIPSVSLTLYTPVRAMPREKAAKNEGEVLVDSSESSVNDVFAEGVFFYVFFISFPGSPC